MVGVPVRSQKPVMIKEGKVAKEHLIPPLHQVGDVISLRPLT